MYDGLKTFSVGFGASTDELEDAKETANFFGTDHHELYVEADKISNILPKIIWHLDEPIADPATIPVYLMSELTKRYVSVVLTGEGADELFAGYPKYKLFSGFFKSIPDRWKYNLYMYSPPSNVFDEKEKNTLFLDNKFTRNDYAKDIIIDKDKFGMNDLLKKDIEYWLPNYLLTKVDKMTMAHSLELRVPFLDKEVAGFARTIPDRLKFKNGATKYLLRKASKAFVPPRTQVRRKLGFPVPLAGWLRERTDWSDALLAHPFISSRFDTEVIKKLVDDHVAGKKDNARKIFVFLMLAAWHSAYFGETSFDY